jgi:hypothetical protein
MFTMLRTLALLASFMLATCEWELSNIKGVTILIGIDSPPNKPNTVIAAAGQNGVGEGYIVSEDGGQTSTFYHPEGGMMDMDIAVSDDESAMCMVGMGLWMKKDSDDHFSRVSTLTGTSQNVGSMPGGFGAAGQFRDADNFYNGVATSTDNGVTWSGSDIGLNSSAGYIARYASFPTTNTWYVTSGTWPMDDEEKQEDLLTSRLTKKGAVRDHKKNVGAEGWVGAVSKTTDGGKTWEMVYHTAAYYFNAISCADENNCIAVAEGDYAVGFHTTDGGKTWTKMITEEMTGKGASLMGAYMKSPTEFWFAGGTGNSATFYHSTDGSTTTLDTLQAGPVMKVTFRSGAGYAALINHQTCAIATYA